MSEDPRVGYYHRAIIIAILRNASKITSESIEDVLRKLQNMEGIEQSTKDVILQILIYVEHPEMMKAPTPEEEALIEVITHQLEKCDSIAAMKMTLDEFYKMDSVQKLWQLREGVKYAINILEVGADNIYNEAYLKRQHEQGGSWKDYAITDLKGAFRGAVSLSTGLGLASFGPYRRSSLIGDRCLGRSYRRIRMEVLQGTKE
ncbi:hypothetical protein [Candidatus Nitrososphaera sp. FF02]|uniref:hypothetical protein n=1 Tax=Candidatus Nitrososphaera sp. FF02 TaxID=3398226 RepID=UPI0039E8F2E9